MIGDNDGSGNKMAIMSTTPEGVITSFNKAAERLLGIGAEEIVGKVTPVMFHDRPELDCRIGAVSPPVESAMAVQFGAIVANVRIDRSSEEEWTYIHRKGHRFSVVLSVSALPDGSGQIVGYCIVAQDRRGQMRAAEILRRQAKLLDLANDAIFVRDLERDTITYWNDGAVRLYGWSTREAMGAYIHDFLKPQIQVASA